jgi:TRAP-type uncharacterized transport system fused permease subunit
MNRVSKRVALTAGLLVVGAGGAFARCRRAGRARPDGIARKLADALAVIMVLSVIGWAIGVPRMIGTSYYPQQFFALILGLVLPMTFLTCPMGRGSVREVVPWWDILLALASMLVLGFIAVEYPSLVNKIFMRPPEIWISGLITTLLVLVLEALRRATGWALGIIISVFLLYGLFGNLISGRLSGRALNGQMLSGYMGYDSNGILGLPMSVASTVVVAFILFGSFLAVTGGSRFFTDAAMLAMGRFRGGSMKIAVLASGLFGSISGSAVANMADTGVITIPMIKRDGYPAHKAAAIEAVASTGGRLMPRVMGAAAFLMAEFLQLSYAAAAIARSRPMGTGFAAMKFGWSAYVIPVLFVFAPTLLMIGAPLDIALAILTAVVGVWLISGALAGYLADRLSTPMRLALGGFGLMALIPAGAFEGAVYSDLAGVIGGLGLMWLSLRRSRAALAAEREA